MTPAYPEAYSLQIREVSHILMLPPGHHHEPPAATVSSMLLYSLSCSNEFTWGLFKKVPLPVFYLHQFNQHPQSWDPDSGFSKIPQVIRSYSMWPGWEPCAGLSCSPNSFYVSLLALAKQAYWPFCLSLLPLVPWV